MEAPSLSCLCLVRDPGLIFGPVIIFDFPFRFLEPSGSAGGVCIRHRNKNPEDSFCVRRQRDIARSEVCEATPEYSLSLYGETLLQRPEVWRQS